ncbi:MarR family winged helix-turn-helix transcriptional regulator [Henriciella marina]|uniref:MarR family winged helix-turn-helix transcriptional regulator n=1 Tax=Henriciella marina TaxID=453851 RepID=UPI00036B0DBD|nr:MarR family winged helix-turn-helix transcriptional regulator [Henriciella marina]
MTNAPGDTLRLDTFLPYRLSVLSNAISRKIADMYEREFNLSIWQWRILAVLGESDGLTSTEVAARTLMDKPAVSRATGSLIDRGLITRTSDSIDRRKSALGLSEAGRDVYNAVIPRARAYEKELLAALSPEDAEALHTLLTRLAQIASPDRDLWSRRED